MSFTMEAPYLFPRVAHDFQHRGGEATHTIIEGDHALPLRGDMRKSHALPFPQELPMFREQGNREIHQANRGILAISGKRHAKDFESSGGAPHFTSSAVEYIEAMLTCRSQGGHGERHCSPIPGEIETCELSCDLFMPERCKDFGAGDELGAQERWAYQEKYPDHTRCDASQHRGANGWHGVYSAGVLRPAFGLIQRDHSPPSESAPR